MKAPSIMDPDERDLRTRAADLGLHGLVEHWEELGESEWIPNLLKIEEQERSQRSLARRLRNAHLRNFKPIADFDWAWPSKVDRKTIEDCLKLRFMDDAANVLLVGPNGVG